MSDRTPCIWCGQPAGAAAVVATSNGPEPCFHPCHKEAYASIAPKPKFISVHEVYLPALGGRVEGSPYVNRYSPRGLTGIDTEGNAWGLYDDVTAYGTNEDGSLKHPRMVWIRFDVGVAAV